MAYFVLFFQETDEKFIRRSVSEGGNPTRGANKNTAIRLFFYLFLGWVGLLPASDPGGK